MIAGEDLALYRQIEGKLKAGGQWRYSRGRPPHPAFKGAMAATDRLLRELPPGARVLVMRDQCLFDVRAGVLASGRKLLLPNDAGEVVYRIPPSALKYKNPGASAPRPQIPIDPLPLGSEVWQGPVDVIIVGCSAWNRDRKRLCSLDWDTTAATLEALGPCEREWNDNSWFIPADVPVACIAADEQEIHEEWPRWAAGHCADAVFTPTRTVVLGDSM